ncbi:exo-beta-N-acetylmuramidase NamZ family protein [Tundrisphaera lichenicola]|uniref:exo-beta-N-acetylmuramidase NamZ family protein n=1 Tax=Tundrisphaera lichenicola TaxID=2029860 RepID=UPI003EB88C85
MIPRVETGLDRWVGEGFAALRGLRVGLIANPTSGDHRLRHAVDLLRDAPEVTLAALFGPEHGIRAEAQDMIGVASGVDSRAGIPVHTLYGPTVESLTPTPEQLEGLDALIFDVQDVGSRYYTFAATMLYAMTAASRAGIRFFVLDRPNPIGGLAIEGPTVRLGFESFVGVHPTPIRHGMTVGELALMFREELSIDIDLSVIACRGWSRGMLWGETGLPWVLPSPNMPTPDTALVYPGGCLVEGTNLSEGRGTTRPFELWGAPWIDPDPLARPAPWTSGVLLRPCSFRPTFHKHSGQTCFGVQPHVTDPSSFAPVWFYTAMLAGVRRQDPVRFDWRREPYEFVSDPIAIDLLFGSDRERQLIESNPGLDELEDLRKLWSVEESDFRERRGPFLLYPA